MPNCQELFADLERFASDKRVGPGLTLLGVSGCFGVDGCTVSSR